MKTLNMPEPPTVAKKRDEEAFKENGKPEPNGENAWLLGPCRKGPLGKDRVYLSDF